MKKIFILCFLLLITSFISIMPAFADKEAISVEKTGDVLSFKGSIEANEGVFVSAMVINPAGKVIYRDSKKSKANGAFEFHLLFDAEDEPGDYRILVRGAEDDEICETVYSFKPSNDSTFRFFRIFGKDLIIRGGTIYGTLPAGTDRNGLAAEFEVEKNAVVTVDGVVQESGKTVNNFTKDVIYRVTAEDKTYSEYRVSADVEIISSGGSGGSGGSSGGGGGGGGGKSSSNVKISVGMPQINEERSAIEPEPKPDLSVPPEASGEYFSDVPKDHWAAGYIEYLVNEEILNGVDEERFCPENNVTREEFVKMLCEALYLETYEPEESAFSDVDISQWYAPYIDALVYEGIVQGVNENMFGIGENILRCDMAVLIERCCNYLKTELTVSENSFNDDADIPEYAKQAIYAMRGTGIIKGDNDNMFMPKKFATRAEAAKMIYVMLKNAG